MRNDIDGTTEDGNWEGVKHVTCRHCDKQTNLMDEEHLIRRNGLYLVIMCEHCGTPLIVRIVNKEGHISPRVL